MSEAIALGPNADRVSLLGAVKPYIAVVAVALTGAVLTATIYFTLLELQWIAFLAGILLASILAMTARAARAERSAASNLGRLGMAEYRLTGQARHREDLEKRLAAANARLRYSDDQLPIMLAFVDESTRYRFHNRAFSNWLGLKDEKIQGQHMRDVLGRKVYGEIESYVLDVAAGHVVRYERTHKGMDGALYQVAVQYLPRFSENGVYAGFYVAITDVTERRHVVAPPAVAAALPATASAAAESGDWQDVSDRILAAINGNEFTLFCHRIMALRDERAGAAHFEVLIRLLEEESGLVPPGAFFPLAEEHGLLPQLDRWVVSHVLDWLATPAGAARVSEGSIYFINVAAATISDPDFPEFVEFHLRRTGLPGGSICIEIDEADLMLRKGDAAAFVRLIRECGCLIAISGYGRNLQSMEVLKQFPVNFVKIHGSIVRQIVAYPIPLAKVAATVQFAHGIGVRTVAEMVEDEGTLALLRKVGVDFAQGFGISLPQPLTEPAWPANVADADAARGPGVKPGREPVARRA